MMNAAGVLAPAPVRDLGRTCWARQEIAAVMKFVVVIFAVVKFVVVKFAVAHAFQARPSAVTWLEQLFVFLWPSRTCRLLGIGVTVREVDTRWHPGSLFGTGSHRLFP